MKKIDERHYMADDSKIIVRKEDNYHMGVDMYLSEKDSIKNYAERDMNDDEKIHYE